jgi:hypothetical protein
MSENVGVLISRKPTGLHGLYKGNFYLISRRFKANEYPLMAPCSNVDCTPTRHLLFRFQIFMFALSVVTGRTNFWTPPSLQGFPANVKKDQDNLSAGKLVHGPTLDHYRSRNVTTWSWPYTARYLMSCQLTVYHSRIAFPCLHRVLYYFTMVYKTQNYWSFRLFV